MPGKPRRLTAGTKPGQLVLLGAPAVMSTCVEGQALVRSERLHAWGLTFSVKVMLATSALALVSASPHDPVPVMVAVPEPC